MELKSLEKLRGKSIIYTVDKEDGFFALGSGDGLADEIQAEVDREYIKAPIGKNGRYMRTVPDAMGEWCLDNEAEVQDYIDRYYMPRPLFDDGEPVQFGDEICLDGEVRRVDRIVRWDEREGWYLTTDDLHNHLPSVNGPMLKRPPTPDTQERIDAEAPMSPWSYCEKYGLTVLNQGLHALYCRKTLHLLKRQRELDARGDA